MWTGWVWRRMRRLPTSKPRPISTFSARRSWWGPTSGNSLSSLRAQLVGRGTSEAGGGVTGAGAFYPSTIPIPCWDREELALPPPPDLLDELERLGREGRG